MQSIKKKRVSKKNKISWRKNINIQDVDDFLEDQRLEERIGKASDKTNEELFTIDVKSEPKVRLTLRQKRKIAAARPPRCFAALENTSKVQDPIVKRNRVRTKEERKHFIAKSIDRANREKGILPYREIQATEDRLKAYKLQDERKIKRNTIDKDVWTMGTRAEQRTEFKGPWIEKHITEHNLCNTGTAIGSIPKDSFQKRSQLQVLAIPHPGTSYNPTLKDHQDLMQSVEDYEKTIIREEDHLKRVTTSMFLSMTAAERDAVRAKEMNAGLDDDEDDVANLLGEEGTEEFKAINPAVVIKKKDKKARRKAREQKEIKQRLLDAKLEKKKITDIHRLRHLNDDIKQLEASLLVHKVRKDIRRELKKVEPRRIGKHKFEEEDIDVNMPSDIAGNLRNLKSEGSILKDRFKSMQRRNIIAPTVDLGLRKRKEVKRFVRNSHKEEQLPLNNKNHGASLFVKK